MFDIGWTEMLVIAIVMIVVVGPKDLPRMLRTFGKTTSKLRAMAGDFQKQFNEALREAELEDVKKSVDELRGLNPANEIRKQLNPFEKAAQDIRSGLDTLKSAPPQTAAPATDDVHTAEPLKNGAADMPGLAGPEAMPAATPAFPAAPPPAPASDAVHAAQPLKNGATDMPAAGLAPVAVPAAAKPTPARATRTPKVKEAPAPAPTAPAGAKAKKATPRVAKATASVPAQAAAAATKPAPKKAEPRRAKATGASPDDATAAPAAKAGRSK